MKKLKCPALQMITRVAAAVTAIGGWFNWIWWLQKRRRKWPKERMNTKKLHALLYQCPSCKAESMMDSRGKRLWCIACGQKWEMNRYGRIRARGKTAEFSHILDWIEWEKAEIKAAIQNGSYYFEDTVRVEMPANGKQAGRQGIAHFSQDAHETRLICTYAGEEYTMIRTGKILEKLNIAYDHLGKGDCFEFPGQEGMLRCYPSKRDVVTKLAYATEEIHRQSRIV